MKNLGDIPVVPVDFFLSSVLPPVEEAILDTIIAKLNSQKHIKGGRWSSFKFSRSPKATGKKEGEAFQGLQTVFRNIIAAASPLIKRAPVLSFQYQPNETSVSERNNSSLPNGHLELVEKKNLGAQGTSSRTRLQTSRWEDIVLPCGFKLDTTGANDVRPCCSSVVLLRER
jgi:hypothetical protein